MRERRPRLCAAWHVGLLVSCLLSLVCALDAAVPRTIQYQGKLTEPDGTLLVGEHTVTFRLYDAATDGTKLWEEPHTVTLNRVDNGVFTVVLGSQVAFSSTMAFNDPLWLTIEVDGGGEFSPRQLLSAVSYALNADTLDGLDSASFLAAAGGGDITAVTAGTALTGGGATGDVTLNVNVGTAASQIVQLDGTGALPAVSGANLTSLNASNLTSGTLADARLSANVSLLGSAIDSAEVTDGTLVADDTDAAFLAAGSGVAVAQGATSWTISATGSGGTITEVVAGAGLTGGGTSGSVTLDVGAGTGLLAAADALSVDVGTSANQIVQLDGTGALPAVSGANLTSLNASNLTSGTLADARLSANVSLLGSAIDSAEVTDGTLVADDTDAAFLAAGSGVAVAQGATSWTISATGGGDITGVAAGTGLTGGGTSGDVTLSLSTPVTIANGGTGAATAATARANLGAASSGANSDIISLGGLTTALSLPQGGTGATTAAAARTNLGLGSIATQDANNVSVTGGSISGITDLGVADGGTGASSAAAARTNLGAAASGANSDITSVSGLTTPLSIAQGGTEAATAAGARANLINCMPIGGAELTSRTATFMVAVFGAGATSGSPDDLWPVPVAGTVSALSARVATAPGTGDSWTVTVRKNGVDTALSCAISGSGVSCSGSGTVSVAAGNRLGARFVEGGNASGTSGASWSACFVPD